MLQNKVYGISHDVQKHILLFTLLLELDASGLSLMLDLEFTS
jgi:hypothetical protein